LNESWTGCAKSSLALFDSAAWWRMLEGPEVFDLLSHRSTPNFLSKYFDFFKAYKGSTSTVRPRFSRDILDSKIAMWKDTQASNLLRECIFATLKIASNLEQKIFFAIQSQL